MKKTLLILTLITLVCASAALTVTAQRPPMAGGYRTIANNDEGAVAAADFAVDARMKNTGDMIKLVAIKKAEQQVVAGRNYALCLNVQDSGGNESLARVVVFLNLQQMMSLTSWTPATSTCSEDTPSAKEQEPNTPNSVAKLQEPNTSTKPQEPNTVVAPPAGPTPNDMQDTGKEQIAGGYGQIENDSAEAVTAAKYAIAVNKKKDKTLKLVAIEHTEQQVVAGMNYALCLRVKGKGDKPGKSHLVHTIVYQDLQNKMSVSSFEKVAECK